MTLTIGELCAGYGGLSTAIEEVFDARLAWVSEYEAAPSKILAHHWPHVPNLGDMTTIEWAAVEPVDIISGGTPCQDLSHAGKRAGMTEGTRSNLWVQMREAVAVIRPCYVIWENVRGAYSACADSEMGRCARCLDQDSESGHAPYLRALGRVVGDLSELGYDCAWHGLTAASVGAPHGRYRVFVLAWATADTGGVSGHPRREPAPRQATRGWARRQLAGRSGTSVTDAKDDGRQVQRFSGGGAAQQPRAGSSGGLAPDTPRDGRDEGRPEPARLVGRSDAAERGDAPANANRGRFQVGPQLDGDPTSTTADRDSCGQHTDGHSCSATPDPVSGGRFGRAHDEVGQAVERVATARSGAGDRAARLVQVDDLDGRLGIDGIPDGVCVGYPVAGDQGEPGGTEGGTYGLADLVGGAVGSSGGNNGVSGHAYDPDSRPQEVNTPAEILWGIYEPAVRRWENVLGRPAPAPTEATRKGAQRLSPRFVEWMQGLPAGHVTDPAIGLTRNEQLKALGNGVVSHQAAAALRYMLAATEGARHADVA